MTIALTSSSRAFGRDVALGFALFAIALVLTPIARAQSSSPVHFTRLTGGNNNEQGRSVAVDGQGYAYTIGTTVSPSVDSVGSLGTNDMVVTKLTPAGVRVWTVRLGGSAVDQGFGIGVDRMGSVFVCGWVNQYPAYSTIFDGVQYNAASDIVAFRLDAATGAKQWARGWGSNGEDQAVELAYDAVTSSVYIVGYTNTSLHGQPYGGGQWDGFLMRVDANGTRVWTRVIGGTGVDQTQSVVVDTSSPTAPAGGGWVYIAGQANANIGTGVFNGGGTDGILVKYDTNGVFQWIRFVGTSVQAEYGQAVGVNTATGLVVLGGVASNVVSLDGSPGNGGDDMMFAAYQPDGTKLWWKQYGGPATDRCAGLTISATTGQVIGVGYVSAAVYGQPFAGVTDWGVFGLDADGNRIWTRSVGGAEEDQATNVATADDGTVYVVGWAANPAWDGQPYNGGLRDIVTATRLCPLIPVGMYCAVPLDIPCGAGECTDITTSVAPCPVGNFYCPGGAVAKQSTPVPCPPYHYCDSTSVGALCPPGKTGYDCSADTTICLSGPCLNGGTCSDGLDSFLCTCAAGFTGVQCQTNINECASMPCRSGTCVDEVNSYRCVCQPGYSGVQCQTNVNECASNPCANGGTCIDGNNGFTCLCPSGWTAASACHQNINECATNNGGCGPIGRSTCNDTPGSWQCTGFIVPGSVSSPDTVLSTSPLLTLGQLSAQRLDFTVSHVQIPFASLTVTVGRAGDTQRLTCADLTRTSAINPASQTVRCTVRNGFGGPYSLYLWNGAALQWTTSAPDAVQYPAPRIDSPSLRQNRTGYSSDPETNLILDTNSAVRVQLYGGYFPVGAAAAGVTGALTITYGSFPCTFVADQSVESVLTCSTAPGSEGQNMPFTVKSDAYSVVSVDTISFPTTPTITAVWGCPVVSGAKTSNCPTEGGVTITISGTNFLQNRLFVSVGGAQCANALVVNPQLLTCELPAGSGGSDRAIIVTSYLTNSAPASLLSYTVPTIHTISGCGSTSQAINCPRFGGSVITLTGTNFGVSGATVLIGSALCTDLTHDVLLPHRQVTCTVPAQAGTKRTVLALQSGGGLGINPNVTLSYAECAPGTYVSDLNCLPCDLGSYSDQPSQALCVPCKAGSYTGRTSGASECLPCAAGSYSKGAASTCSECRIGTFIGAAGQAECANCAAGRFSNSTGASDCVDCSAGSAQAVAGQSSCGLCAAGKYSFGRADACIPCLASTMSPREGASVCPPCPGGSDSPPNSALCSCASGTYGSTRDLDMTCRTCPIGAVCDNAGVFYDQLLAADGWWRESNTSLNYFKCLVASQCVGGGCAPNRDGPICAVCKEGYSQGGDGQECTACPSRANSAVGTVLYVVLVTVAVCLVFWVVWRTEGKKVARKAAFSRVKAYRPEDRVKPNVMYNLKLFLSYVQIATTLMGYVSIPWPSYFQRFIQYFDFINLNFVPWGSVQCLQPLNFYTKLVLVSVVPWGVVLLIGLVPAIILAIQNRFDFRDSSAARASRVHQRRKIIRLIVFALFLIYPALSKQVLSFFACRDIAGRSYLISDFNLQCYTDEWYRYLPLAVADVIVYAAGIPLAVFAVLWHNRFRLHHPATKVAFGLAYEAYVAELWYFELVDMAEKLVLTSLLTFFPSAWQCPVGMLCVLGYLLCLLLTHPYVRTMDDRMSGVVQVHLLLILLMGHLLTNEDFTPGSAEDVLGSVLLFAVLSIMLLVLLYHGVILARKYVRKAQRKAAAVNEREKSQIRMTPNPLKRGQSGRSKDGSGTGSGGSGGDGSKDVYVECDSESGSRYSGHDTNTSRDRSNRSDRNRGSDKENAGPAGSTGGGNGSGSDTSEMGPGAAGMTPRKGHGRTPSTPLAMPATTKDPQLSARELFRRSTAFRLNRMDTAESLGTSPRGGAGSSSDESPRRMNPLQRAMANTGAAADGHGLAVPVGGPETATPPHSPHSPETPQSPGTAGGDNRGLLRGGVVSDGGSSARGPGPAPDESRDRGESVMELESLGAALNTLQRARNSSASDSPSGTPRLDMSDAPTHSAADIHVDMPAGPADAAAAPAARSSVVSLASAHTRVGSRGGAEAFDAVELVARKTPVLATRLVSPTPKAGSPDAPASGGASKPTTPSNRTRPTRIDTGSRNTTPKTAPRVLAGGAAAGAGAATSPTNSAVAAAGSVAPAPHVPRLNLAFAFAVSGGSGGAGGAGSGAPARPGDSNPT